MLRRILIQIILPVFVCFLTTQVAVARQTKEEKAAKRAAYWGLFADVYRAGICIDDSPGQPECAIRALKNAEKHVSQVDLAVGQNSSDFAIQIEKILILLESNRSADAEKSIVKLRGQLISDFASNTAPVVQPSIELGKRIFGEYCGGCHGDGRGAVGHLNSSLRIKPGAFSNPSRFNSQSPFGIYAVMIHGVDNSEMTSFLDILGVDELWSVAFYASSLAYISRADPVEENKITFIKGHPDDFALSILAFSLQKN